MEANKKKKDAEVKTTEEPAKRRPAQTFRIDDVSASVWPREVHSQGATRTFYSVTFERSYKDRDGAYRYTKSFDPDSLGKLVSVAQSASEWIVKAGTPAEG